ncbi:FliG C-terminal domain-containing protein [uncultured Algimonas sp.]|uniref:FliG C-terminal domain-containing protein n=1 Tax=uncultured Algimonas sp. TaxID=1547920 RepID=UPI0026039AFB|nr:FliG C-terminal domain-containing protein [uncultured Algimonas sp.]
MTTSMSRLTPGQRAAVVLVSLNPEQAKPLAEMLGMPAMRRVQKVLADLPHISEADVLASFADFITQLAAWRSGLRGGEAESFDLLTKAVGDALVEKIRGPVAFGDQQTDTWTKFGQLSPDVIADYIGTQHASVAAIMMSQLPGDRIPVVLGLMPKDAAVEAIGQLSRPEDPALGAVAIAERLVETELLASAIDPMSDPKIVMIGETLGTLPRELRDAALERLEQEDEARAAAIRSTLLRIEDLPLRLPTKSVQVVFREIGREILVKGLAAIGNDAPEVSTFLLGNIAQRMADQYREDVAEIGDLDDAAKDRAIGNLVREVLGLSRRGSIALISLSGDAETD